MCFDGLEVALDEDVIKINANEKSLLLKDKADIIAEIYERANEIKSLSDFSALLLGRLSKQEQKKFSEIVDGILAQED